MTESNQYISKEEKLIDVAGLYEPQLKRLSKYERMPLREAVNASSSFRNQLNEISDTNMTFDAYKEDALERGKNIAYAIKINTEKGEELTTRLIKNTSANGLAALALQIIADDEKDNLQKQKELAWVHGIAKKIKNRTISHLTEKMMEDTPLNFKEKWQKFKEETEFGVRKYIIEKREEFNEWKNSPLAQKIKAPAQFAIGAVAGFVAADQAPEFVNTQTAIIAHGGLITARGISEGLRLGIRELEFRHPRIAELSQKIAAQKTVQRLFGDVEMASDIAEVFGKSITKLQTHPAVAGATAGIFFHTGVEALKFPEGQVAADAHSTVTSTEHKQTVTSGPTQTQVPTATETPFSTMEPNPTATPSQVLPQEHGQTVFPENYSPGGIRAEYGSEPITSQSIPTSQGSVTYDVSSESTGGLTDIAFHFYGDPNGNGVIKVILKNADVFTNSARPNHEAASNFIEYAKLHSDLTLRQIWNESAKLGHATQVSEWFTKGFNVIPQYLNGEQVKLVIPEIQ